MTKPTNHPSYFQAAPVSDTASLASATTAGERELPPRCLERWENEGGRLLGYVTNAISEHLDNYTYERTAYD
jgi:hypothetical protein